MFNNLIKTQPDWHEPLNQNFITAADKLQLLADFAYDETDHVYAITLRNIPEAVASSLPHTLPDFFAIAGRMPNDYKEGAAFRLGAVDFVSKYAWFEAGDVRSILFDRLEQRCFFRLGGGKPCNGSLAAYAGSAYAGLSYLT